MSRASRSAAVLSFLAVVVAMPAFAADPLQVKTLFRTGIYSDSVGSGNLVARDVTGDNIVDAISCSAGSAFVVSKSGSDLGPVWFSDARGCMSVAAGDTDADGHEDVIVGGYANATATLAVFDPRSFGPPRVQVKMPFGSPMDVAFGDVDHDGTPELVVLTNSDVLVYDAKTLALRWIAAGKGGGRHAFIADLEGDGQNEIITSSGHVLDGVTHAEKWGYVGGFGSVSAVGDIDADGKAEIVYQSSTGVGTIIDGDTMATRTVNLSEWADSLAIGDAQNDNYQEILVGNNQWGAIRGVRASDGVVLWSIDNPEHGCSAVAVGDITGDGTRDVLWGAGLTSSGPDALFVGSPAAPHSITWRGRDLDGNFGAVVADVDNDGKLELVLKTEQSDSGYSHGVVQILDLETRAVERTLNLTGSAAQMRIQRVAVGQLDADAALEIAIVGPSYYDPYLAVFDGATGTQEYTSPYAGWGNPSLWYEALAIANVDADPVDEIFIATSDSHFEALNGATNFVQWSTGVLDGVVRDCAVADLDNNGVKEVVLATDAGFYVLNAATGAELLHTSISGGAHRVAASVGRFAVATNSGALSLYAADRTPVWACGNANVVNTLSFGTVAGVPRLLSGDSSGNLRLYPIDGATCPSPALQRFGTDSIASIATTDVTGDGKPELILAKSFGVEIDSVAANGCTAAVCPEMALAFTTTSPFGMTLTGSSTGPAAIASVRYETSGATVTSGAGTINGSNWSVGPIQFWRGGTTITVTVIDANDNVVIGSYALATGGYAPALPPEAPSAPRRAVGR